MFRLYFVLYLIFVVISGNAQTIHLDGAFGVNGKFSYSLFNGYDFQFNHNGEILICGNDKYNSSSLIKIDTVGNLVNNFGLNGLVQIDNVNIEFLKIDKNNNIYLFGSDLKDIEEYSDDRLVVVKINNLGKVDETFGENGYYFIEIQDLAEIVATSIEIDQDDNIFMVYYFEKNNRNIVSHVLKLNSDGIVDGEFGNNGQIEFASANGNCLMTSCTNFINSSMIISGAIMNDFGSNIILYTIDSQGNIIKTTGGNESMVINHSNVFGESTNSDFSGENIYVTGYAFSNTSTIIDLFIAKLDLNREFVNEFGDNGRVKLRLSDFASFSFQAIELENENVLVLGDGNTFDGNFKSFLIILNKFGEMIKTVGDNGVFYEDTSFDIVGDHMLKKEDKIYTLKFMNYNVEEVNTIVYRYRYDNIMSLKRLNYFNLNIHPTLTSRFLYINDHEKYLNQTYQIFDSKGCLMETNQLVSNGVDVSKLASGNYFIHISHYKGKFVKM